MVTNTIYLALATLGATLGHDLGGSPACTLWLCTLLSCLFSLCLLHPLLDLTADK